MTALFFVLLVILFIIVTFLPLRFILFLACAYKFASGQRWQNKRITNNREVCRLELINFLQEQKLSHVVTNFDEKWSRQARKHMRLPALEEKLTLYFRETVRIFLPRQILHLCETPNQLIEYVGYTSSVIKLPQCDRNEMKVKTNPRLKKRSTPLHYHLHNFIMSRIPSDIFRIRNPSLGIEKDPKSGQLVVTQKKSKRLTEAVKFGFVSH